MRIGKVTENVLKRSVFKLHKVKKDQESAAVGTDCAVFINKNSQKDENAAILSSISPVTVKALHAGRYAVTGAANNLLCQNVRPDMINLQILVPEDAEETVIKQIMKDAAEQCTVYDTYIAGGHTEVTTALTRPLVTAVATGHADHVALFACNQAAAGQDLILTKWIGLEGTAMLAEEKAREICNRYPAHMVEEAVRFGNYLSIASEAAVAAKSGASAMHDVSGGGIFAALWEMAEGAGTGLEVDLKKIPVKQETIEICEFFEINPYQLISGGALLIAAADGKEMVRRLQEEGIPAVMIGRLTDGNDRIIHNEEENRYLEMPQADEIHKVLG
ncbi:MAG: AIR synthase-related protein [Butyrivibrio sp.]|jgi:hydrogenase maturation factor|nr:AIR synthase-related protein [Butyrivibrio sp.]